MNSKLRSFEELLEEYLEKSEFAMSFLKQALADAGIAACKRSFKDIIRVYGNVLEFVKESWSSFLDTVRLSREGKTFSDPNITEFSQKDLELALQIDRFSFAMQIEKRNGNLIAKKVVL